MQGIEQAVAELTPAVHLLARMSSAQPALAVSLAQMRLPSGADGPQAHSSRDLVDLIASALSVLPQLHSHAQLRHNLLSLLGADCSLAEECSAERLPFSSGARVAFHVKSLKLNNNPNVRAGCKACLAVQT